MAGSSFNNASNSAGANSGDGSGSVVVLNSSRRRDKRRHLMSSASNWLDFKDPSHIVSLAVRFDEASGLSAMLEEPLESGRLYSQDDFWHALQFLEEETSVPKKKNVPKRKAKRALTPIILSGLLMVDNAVLMNKGSNNQDLVLYAQSLRVQALKRLRQKSSRARHRVLTMILTVVVGLVAIVWRTIFHLRITLLSLGYMGGGSDVAELLDRNTQIDGYTWWNDQDNHRLRVCEDSFCHDADANTWAHFRDFPIRFGQNKQQKQHQQHGGVVCHTHSCPTEHRVHHVLRPLARIPGRGKDFRHGQAPYVMHTLFTQGMRRKKKQPRMFALQDNIQWLGDSHLYAHYVRNILQNIDDDTTSLRVLDIGCGLGGLLYALWPSIDEYYGIALSPAEIAAAKQLAQQHGLLVDNQHLHTTSSSIRITFRQASIQEFLQEEPHHHAWDLIVAVETFSWIPKNVTTQEIVPQLSKLLSKRGKLMIVDDVIDITTGIAQENHHLFQHLEWIELMESNGFALEQARDLGLEHGMPQLEDEHVVFLATEYWNVLSDLGVWQYSFGSLWLQHNDEDNNSKEDDYDYDYDSNGASSSNVWKRLMRLFQDTLRISQRQKERTLAHTRGDLWHAYYLWNTSGLAKMVP